MKQFILIAVLALLSFVLISQDCTPVVTYGNGSQPTALYALSGVNEGQAIIGFYNGDIKRAMPNSSLDHITNVGAQVSAVTVKGNRIYVQTVGSSNLLVLNMSGAVINQLDGVDGGPGIAFTNVGRRVQSGVITQEGINEESVVIYNNNGSLRYAYDPTAVGAEEFVGIYRIATGYSCDILAIAEADGEEVVIFDDDCQTLDVIPIGQPVSVEFYNDLLYVGSADGTIWVVPPRENAGCGEFDESKAVAICNGNVGIVHDLSISEEGLIWALDFSAKQVVVLRDPNQPIRTGFTILPGDGNYGFCFFAPSSGTYVLERSVNGGPFIGVSTATFAVGNHEFSAPFVEGVENKFRVSTAGCPVWCTSEFTQRHDNAIGVTLITPN